MVEQKLRNYRFEISKGTIKIYEHDILKIDQWFDPNTQKPFTDEAAKLFVKQYQDSCS